MRKLFTRIIASLALIAMSANCSGSGSGSFTGTGTGNSTSDPATMPWSAAVVTPVTPIVLGPGQTIVIVINLVPINGFVFTSPVFFNTFTFANPSLTIGCPGIITVGAPIIGAVSPIGIPSVTFPLTPIGFGTCVIPINAGIAGVIPLSVQVAGSAAVSPMQQRYTVSIAKGR